MAHDNLEVGDQEKKAGIVESEDEEKHGRVRSGSIGSNSDSSSSSSDTEDEDGEQNSVPDGSSNQKQGPIDKVRDYRRRDRRLHRQHRGLMQWKVSSPVPLPFMIPRVSHVSLLRPPAFRGVNINTIEA